MARFTITLDDDIHNLLKEQAERDRRTLGQEIAYLLELYVPAYQKNSPGMSPTPASSTPSLHYPEGVRSPIPENPEGRPIITNDYNSYYQPTVTAPAPRKRTIQ